MPGEVAPPDHAALSWRDVYKAVSESEVRIIAAVHDSVQPLKNTSDDHEMRLRHFEQEGCKVAQEACRKAEAIGAKLDALTLVVNANTNARRGMLEALSAGQKTILFVTSIIGTTVVVFNVVVHFLE